MNLNANKSRLNSLTKDIGVRWNETKATWSDSKSVKFERDFMQELFPRVNLATNAIEKLEELLNKIRSECE